jgi:hypothetical protein
MSDYYWKRRAAVLFLGCYDRIGSLYITHLITSHYGNTIVVSFAMREKGGKK